MSIRPFLMLLGLLPILLPVSVQAAERAPRALRWEEKGLFGQTEEKKIPRGKTFDGMVSDYFARMARLCKGDFAEHTEPAEKAGPRTLQVAEMACVDDRENPAAALLFVGKGRTFLVIAQEGTADQLSQAMAQRDKTENEFRKTR